MIGNTTRYRQTDIYRNSYSVGKRRFLSGTKEPPFFFEMVTSFEKNDNVTHYSTSLDYYVSVSNGNQVLTSASKGKIQNLSKSVFLIRPIIGTTFFFFVDDEKSIFVINNHGIIQKIPDVTAFTHTSCHFFIINEKICLLVNTKENSFCFYELQCTYQSISFKKKAEWNGIIKNVTSIATLSISDDCLIIITDFTQAYYCIFNPLSVQEPKFKQLSDHVPNLIISQHQLLPQQVLCNSSHLIWLRYDRLIIIPIPKLLSSNNEFLTITIGVGTIASYLKLVNDSNLLIKGGLVPAILTKYHVVLTSCSSPGPRTVDADFLLAICLENGEVAMVKQMNFINIKYLSYGPDIESFILVSHQCVLKANFSNEVSLTTVKPIRTIRPKSMVSLNHTSLVSPSEVLFRLIQIKEWEKALSFIDKLLVEYKLSNTKVFVLSLIYSELEMLLCIEKGESGFKPIALESNSRVFFEKCLYSLRMKSFSSLSRYYKDQQFYKTAPFSKKALNIALHCCDYPFVILSASKDSSLESFIIDISIKSPLTLIPIVSQWNIQFAQRIIPKVVPFLKKSFEIDSFIPLLKKSFQEGKNSLSSDILWLLTFDKKCSFHDDYIDKLIDTSKPHFVDFIELWDICLRSGLKKVSERIRNLGSNSQMYEKTNEIRSKYSNFKNSLVSSDLHIISREDIVKQLESILSQVSELTALAEIDASIIQKGCLNHNKISATDFCSSCSQSISSGKVYSFMCNHTYHPKCLLSKMKEVLDDEQLQKLVRLESVPNPNSGTLEEIEDILLQDCPMCGMIAINRITKPIPKKEFPFEL